MEYFFRLQLCYSVLLARIQRDLFLSEELIITENYNLIFDLENFLSRWLIKLLNNCNSFLTSLV